MAFKEGLLLPFPSGSSSSCGDEEWSSNLVDRELSRQIVHMTQYSAIHRLVVSSCLRRLIHGSDRAVLFLFFAIHDSILLDRCSMWFDF